MRRSIAIIPPLNFPAETMKKNILIITGEASGDLRAAEVVKHLKTRIPDVDFWGFGGENLKKEGVRLTEHIRDLSIVGIWEVVIKLPKILSQIRRLKKEIRRKKPSLAILVDYPGMNLKIARFLKKENIPVVYYIIPQMWAWGSWRIKTFKKYVDLALCLFPFEERFLKEEGVNSHFTGHPVVELIPDELPPVDSQRIALALLPGSRQSEVLTTLPLMLKAAELVQRSLGPIDINLAKTSNLEDETYRKILNSSELKINFFTDDTFKALIKSDLAIVTSGTATLEAALSERPFVITYRASWLTAFLFRHFADTSVIGLVNIVAGKKIVPELLQENATADNLSKEILSLAVSDEKYARKVKELKKVKEKLSEKQPALQAAKKIADFWDAHTASI